MVKIIKPLNDTQVKSAKPKEKDFTLSDGNGLYLLVKSNGSKIWRFNYISPDSKKRTLVSFGSYPEITLLNARQKRDEYRSLVFQGVDPQQHKQSIQNQSKKEKDNTFYKVAERWLEQQNSRDITSGTIRRIKNSFVNYIYPILGDIPVSQLKAKDFIEALKPLECAGKLDTVKRISQRINKVMTYAVNNDLIEYNPTGKIGAVFKVAHKQNMPSLPPSELPRVMKAISLASIELQTRCLIEWQLLTI